MAFARAKHSADLALIVIHAEFMNLLCFVLELVAALADIPRFHHRFQDEVESLLLVCFHLTYLLSRLLSV